VTGRRQVALVTTSFPLEAGSMSGIFVARLAARLADEVGLEVVAPAGERPVEVVPAGYTLTTFRYAPRRWQRLAHRSGGIPAALAARSPAVLLLPGLLAALAAASAAAARRSDLVHANWAATAAFAGPCAGRPLVTTLRGSDVARAERSAPDRRLLLRALRRSTAVALVGESLRRRAAALAPARAGRMVVIPNGVDDAFFTVAGERRESESLRLVSVGSLVPGKGLDRVLRAFATLPATVRLRLVGDGPLAGELRALAGELGVAERLELAGQLPPAAMPGVLREADLFVFASDSEGRPNAVVEALAAGLPVVAPAIPAVRELVDDDAARLYPPGDEAALAAALTALTDDAGQRRGLAAAGQRRARELRLTWADTARRYADLYREVLAASSRTSSPSGSSGRPR
jgi:glycosyltransferase involved in cell wall biosynthesis